MGEIYIMRKRKKDFREYVADFETTTIDEIKEDSKTEVWAAAICELDSGDSKVFNSMEKFMDYVKKLGVAKIGFHNLKFDGSFIVTWLLNNGYEYTEPSGKRRYDIAEKTFSTLISSDGQWYSIDVNLGNGMVHFWDTYKLIPMSVAKMGDPKKGFPIQHHKLSIDYTLHNGAGEVITKEEEDYILNDIYVVRECLQIMYANGLDRETIGSCAINGFRTSFVDTRQYREYIPDMSVKIPKKYDWVEGTFDSYLRKFYKGAFVYCEPDNCRKFHNNIKVYDVNSLYPSMMLYYISKNKFPIGYPRLFKGDGSDIFNDDNCYSFYHIRASFQLKKGMLPTIQIHGNINFNCREYATSSIVKVDSEYIDVKPELYLSEVDLEIFKEHYNIFEIEYIDGARFRAERGIFDNFLRPYVEMKENCGDNMAQRLIAKLVMNNSYGKFSTSPDSSYKNPYLDEHGVLKFNTVEKYDKKIYHVGIGAAITSYARAFTINAAQKAKSYDAFCYSDTDSIHLLADRLPENWEELIPVHHTKLGHWDLEAEPTKGIFIGPKRYAEYIKNKEGKYEWKITCAGVSPEGKKYIAENIEHYSDEQFVVKSGCKQAKIISGGTVIIEKDKKLINK